MIQELKGHYENQEWVWDTEINPEIEKYVIKLNGDLTPLIYFYYTNFKGNLFLPNWSNRNDAIDFNIIAHLPQNKNINFFFLDNEIVDFCKNNIRGINKENLHIITPNWSKYIPEDSAVLFLSEEDKEKHNNIIQGRSYIIYKNSEFDFNEIYEQCNNEECPCGRAYPKSFTEVTIIVPYINFQNIEQINKIAKELKEKYGVEYVEVIATHCFLNIHDGLGEAMFNDNCIWGKCYIDYFVTTDSTSILNIKTIQNLQDKKYTERLKVIDCIEFFETFLKS